MPEEGDFFGREGVGFVDEVADVALQLQGLGGERAGRLDGAGVFLAEVVERGDRERILLAADFFHLGDECVGIEVHRGLKLLAGFGDVVLDTKPIEKLALCSVHVFGER